MKTLDLIHEQSCRVDFMEEQLEIAKDKLADLEQLYEWQQEHKKVNTSKLFFTWIIDTDKYDELTDYQKEII